MKQVYKFIIVFLLAAQAISCDKWVDVKPSDRLGEDQLFVDEQGYQKALNGIYVELTSPAVYGENLSTGAIDVLAQYYFMSVSTHRFFNLTTFVYTDAGVKSIFDASWSKTYELINNCNVILEKCGDAPSEKLPQPYFGLIKGEALALRAMLHFDMLRLFGPIYNEQTMSAQAIPYANKALLGIHPMLSAEAVMDSVLGDFNKALTLLADVDPVRTEGVRNFASPDGRNDFHYRQYRLNYYATKGLLARAYLWANRKPQALTQVEEILAEVQTPERNVFPHVTFANATNTERPDRVFSTEVMFALYKLDRVSMFNSLFNVALQPNTKLSVSNGDINETRINNMYDDLNDFRRRVWQSASNGVNTATTNMKYVDVVDAPGRYMVPLVRVAELLLIGAECETDHQRAISYLNRLRNARNTVSLNPADRSALLLEITKEYRREMLGEGQLFFHYKRLARTAVPNHASVPGTPEKAMVLSNYVIPIPDSELQNRR